MLHVVIMAGGSGTRFWPASRDDLPKQLLALVGERTLLQATVDRLAGLAPVERVLIAANARLVDAIREQLPDLPADAILAEPCKRDTAPCIGLAALKLVRNDPDAIMAVMPSDHVISPDAVFRESIRAAAELVELTPDRIVTFGIKPSYPAEIFGYIERGELLAEIPARAADAPLRLYVARQFREKPKLNVARQYLAAGNFYWNAGIFVWRAQTILDSLARHEPQMHAHLQKIAQADAASYPATLEREFAAIRGVSIDYAVMERAKNVVVLEAPFGWDDVGSWQAMGRLRPVDAEGNAVTGKHLGFNTRGCVIRSTDDHLVVTLGLADTIVVHTPDATLVANKHDEESIRQVVKLLAERGWTEYL